MDALTTSVIVSESLYFGMTREMFKAKCDDVVLLVQI